jgi:hypothetical protein
MYKIDTAFGDQGYLAYPAHNGERAYLAAKLAHRMRHFMKALTAATQDTVITMTGNEGPPVTVKLKDIFQPVENALYAIYTSEQATMTEAQLAGKDYLKTRFAVQFLWEALTELHVDNWEIFDAANKLTLPGAAQLWINKDADNKKRLKIRLATALTDNLTVNYVDKTITQMDDGNGGTYADEAMNYPAEWVPFDAFGGGLETPA